MCIVLLSLDLWDQNCLGLFEPKNILDQTQCLLHEMGMGTAAAIQRDEKAAVAVVAVVIVAAGDQKEPDIQAGML